MTAPATPADASLDLERIDAKSPVSRRRELLGSLLRQRSGLVGLAILSLLDQKTRGNLTAEEREVLAQVLYELRMRFVEATGGGKRIIEP